jgi:threonine aldolase
VLERGQLEGLIRADNEHLVRTRMVCLENTHNRGAGKVQPYGTVQDICRWAHDHHLRTHLDGARLFNAVAATGISAADWSQHFDTVSICFSKGLGAPVGSALAGSKELILEARRHRKLFGGGMRQAGIIAAGALYAMTHHRERLGEDHANAQILVEAVRNAKGTHLQPEQIDTNMVIFEVDPALGSATDFVAALEEQGVLVLAIAPTRIRAVTHLDVNKEQVQRAAEVIPLVAERLAAGERPAAHNIAAY